MNGHLMNLEIKEGGFEWLKLVERNLYYQELTLGELAGWMTAVRQGGA